MLHLSLQLCRPDLEDWVRCRSLADSSMLSHVVLGWNLANRLFLQTTFLRENSRGCGSIHE